MKLSDRIIKFLGGYTSQELKDEIGASNLRFSLGIDTLKENYRSEIISKDGEIFSLKEKYDELLQKFIELSQTRKNDLPKNLNSREPWTVRRSRLEREDRMRAAAARQVDKTEQYWKNKDPNAEVIQNVG